MSSTNDERAVISNETSAKDIFTECDSQPSTSEEAVSNLLLNCCIVRLNKCSITHGTIYQSENIKVKNTLMERENI